MIRGRRYGSFSGDMNSLHEMWDYLKAECMRRGIDYNHYQELCQLGKRDLLNFGIEKFTTRQEIEQYVDFLIGDLGRFEKYFDDQLFENNPPHEEFVPLNFDAGLKTQRYQNFQEDY
jgi:hypothetical protein